MQVQLERSFMSLPPLLRQASWLMLLAAAAVLLFVLGRTAWRLQEAAALERMSEPLQQAPDVARMRLLIVGDRTAVGTGASSPHDGMAGLIAQDFPDLANFIRLRGLNPASRHMAFYVNLFHQRDRDPLVERPDLANFTRMRGLSPASRHMAIYVNLFHQRDRDPFVEHPGPNAPDGLHPGDAGYRVWYDELKMLAGLPRLLAAARACAI